MDILYLRALLNIKIPLYTKYKGSILTSMPSTEYFVCILNEEQNVSQEFIRGGLITSQHLIAFLHQRHIIRYYNYIVYTIQIHLSKCKSFCLLVCLMVHQRKYSYIVPNTTILAKIKGVLIFEYKLVFL